MKYLMLLGLLATTATRAAEPGATIVTEALVPAPPALTALVQHVDPAAADRWIKDKQATVLDIRTPSEFKAGHIAGATNIDYRAKDFTQRLSTLDRSKPYLIHCASGRRTTSALALFKKLGFKEIAHLDGGLIAWQKAAKPVVK